MQIKTIKNLPYDPDLEREVLGLFIRDKNILESYIGELSTDTFYLKNHQIIFEALKETYQKEGKVDILILKDFLKKKNLLGEIGGENYLIDLVDLVGIEENIEEYIRNLKLKYILRKIISFSNQIAQKGYDEYDVENILSEIETFTSKIGLEITQQEKFVSLEDIIDVYLEELDRKIRGDSVFGGVSTGYEKLDEMIGGLKFGEFNILAARPSVGKTALALNFALNAAKKYTVLFFSIEMTQTQLFDRLVSIESGIENYKLQKGILSNWEQEEIHKTIADMRKLPIYIDDSTDINPFVIKTRSFRLKTLIEKEREKLIAEGYSEENLPKPLGLIIIDHLQLLHFPKTKGIRFESREKEMSAISRYLKLLAKELNVAILAISQLSRSPMKDKGKPRKPRLSDLRDSGALEQDASVVMLLHREFAYDVGGIQKGEPNIDNVKEKETELIIGKNRHGKTGTIPMVFVGSTYKFYERDDSLNT